MASLLTPTMPVIAPPKGSRADGLLWVVNPGRHRLEAYTFDGDLQSYWGEESLGI